MSVLDPRSLAAKLRGLFKGPDEFDLTEGGIGWPLFYLSLPIVITNLLQTAYNLADTFWLGRYSSEALAAVSFGFPIVFLFISLGFGIAVAGSILVAQHTGAEEPEEAEYAASQTVTLATLASLLIGGVAYVLVGDVLGLIGADPAYRGQAAAYLEVMALGMVFIFGFWVFVSLMRGYGDTVTPMLVMFGAVALNVILDPFVIFGWWVFPEMGIEGAAYATVFARGLAMLVGMAIMLEGSRGVQIRLRQMVPDLSMMRRLLSLGVPATVEGTGRALTINLMLVIVAGFATPVVAAFGVAIRVFSVIFLPAIAVARGVETMTGQNIGAGSQDRAQRANDFAALAMFLILSGAAVLVWLGAPAIVSVFTDDPDIVQVGTDFLRIVAPTFGFTGVMRAYSGGFRGAGKTLTAAAIAITTLGIVRVPLAYVGAELFHTSGFFAAFAVSNVVGGALALAWFRRGTWRDVDLTDRPSRVPDADIEAEGTADD